jgi:hypothetical protein
VGTGLDGTGFPVGVVGFVGVGEDIGIVPAIPPCPVDGVIVEPELAGSAAEVRAAPGDPPTTGIRLGYEY